MLGYKNKFSSTHVKHELQANCPKTVAVVGFNIELNDLDFSALYSTAYNFKCLQIMSGRKVTWIKASQYFQERKLPKRYLTIKKM